MSILVIWSSPNLNGLTAAAKSRIIEGIEGAGSKTEVLHLNQKDIQRCLACGNGWGICRSEGRCVIGDDFQGAYQQMIAADGIVLVTAVYWHDLTEILKCFLDRLRRCEAAHNHDLKEKKCLLVACAGGSGRGAIQCLDHLEHTLGNMEMVTLDRLPVIRFNQDYMLPALSKAGQAFAEHLRQS